MYDRYAFKNDLGRAGMVLLVMLASQNFMSMPFLMMRRNAQLAAGSAFTPLTAALANLIIYLAAMVFTLFFAVYIFQRKPAFLFPVRRVRPDYAVPAVGAGMLGVVASSLAVSFLLVLLQSLGLGFPTFTPPMGNGWAADLVTILHITALPPILEELLFRGAIMQPLRKYGDRLAIVVSALLFAACHGTLPQMLGAFFIGLVLGLFTVRSGSLLPAIFIHLINNALATLTSAVTARTDIYVAAAWSWMYILIALVLGGFCCRFLSRRFGRVWWVAPGGTPAVPRRDAAWAVLTCPPIVTAIVLYFLNMLRYSFMG